MSSTITTNPNRYSAGVTWGPGNRLERVEIPGGYATIVAGGVPEYHYYTTDHVGNNRVVVSEDGVIEQVVHYYPFGGQYADAGLNLSAQQYKHGGKELDPAYGLDWHDFGARPYYAPLAAWLHPDALAGDYTWLSPYCYCANNPINACDPTGMIVEDPDSVYQTYKNYIDTHINLIQDRIDNMSVTNDEYNATKKYLNELKRIMVELEDLCTDKDVYQIIPVTDNKEAVTTYDNETGKIICKIYNPPTNALINSELIQSASHELKHCHQHCNGEVSLITNEGYDLMDETDAYNRERMINLGMHFFLTPNKISKVDNRPYRLTPKDVLDIGRKELNGAYDNLPRKRHNVKKR